MKDPRLAPARIRVEDVETLGARARALAGARAPGEEDARAAFASLVRFRLGGLDCALEARVVERALARLPGAAAVAAAPGGERAFAFVDDRPVLVADLSGAVAGAPRAAAHLAGSAVLLVATAEGSVAIAVDGPLELIDERLAATAPESAWGAGGGVRLCGQLADGTPVISTEWLVGWASRGGR